MAFLQEISLFQYRNYNAFRQTFNHRLVGITGKNGSGKTNLIDAIYLLCYTKSYFSSLHQTIVKEGYDAFRVSGLFESGDKQNEITCIYKEGKKEVSCNAVVYEKNAEHIGKFSAVMISPDDLNLVNAGSEERRKWIDGLLAQTDINYLQALLHYQKIINQRNAWLRDSYGSQSKEDLLSFYDAQLSVAGDYIYLKRKTLLEVLLPEVQQQYGKLCQGVEQISWHYKSDLQAHNMREILHNRRTQDGVAQRTTWGIHRDDIILSINDMPAKQFASQGQKKSLLFAMKLAQYFFIKQTSGHKPILLLDDIFEKLDAYRLQALRQIIMQDAMGQVFITDTDKSRVLSIFGQDEPIDLVDFG